MCLILFCIPLQFPHLVFGAVASSAPIEAKLDFSAYSNVKWRNLRSQYVRKMTKDVKLLNRLNRNFSTDLN